MSFHRVFLLLLAGAAVAWLCFFTLGQLERWEMETVQARYDRAVHEARQRDVAALQDYLTRQKRGERTSVPQPSFSRVMPEKDLMVLIARRARLQSFQWYAGAACGGIALAWIVTMLMQNEHFHRRRAAPGRPADPGAGEFLAQLRRSGTVLIARAEKRRSLFLPHPGREVHIDARRGTVTFVRCKFVTGFTSSRRDERLELPLADILGARMVHHRDGATLALRTTSGTVNIGDHLQSFQPVAEALFDAIEVNRASPESYRAALAREPVVRTPWYGWFILVGSIAAIVGGLIWAIVR